jgi:5-methylcytosine-specific restriction protein A
MPRQCKTYTPDELMMWIPALIAANNLHAFYICHAWLHLRDDAMKAQHHECQLCKAKGKAVPATTVHHVKTVRRFPWLALTLSNLLCLCDDCHWNIHHPHKSKKWDDEQW